MSQVYFNKFYNPQLEARRIFTFQNFKDWTELQIHNYVYTTSKLQ